MFSYNNSDIEWFSLERSSEDHRSNFLLKARLRAACCIIGLNTDADNLFTDFSFP